MTDPFDTPDPLEAELAALRPADLPPELLATIGRELSESATAARRRWVAAAVALAACVAAAAVLVPLMRPSDVGRPKRLVATTTRASPPPIAGDAPALYAYRRAVAGSESDLDELLDRHAARSLPAGPRVTAFTELSSIR